MDKREAKSVLDDLLAEIELEANGYVEGGVSEMLAKEKIEALKLAIEALEKSKISIKTDAGVIEAEITPDPYYPGICLGFIPESEECYIDLAVAESPTKQCQVDETEGNLNLYVYSDIFCEDFTHKYVFTKKMVQEALSGE